MSKVSECFLNHIYHLHKLIISNCISNVSIWYKLKLTLRPPCFVVEFFLVDGVLDTTFKVPIIMKIYMCKIQDEAVIIIWKNKSQNDFLTPCTMRQHGGWKKYKKNLFSSDLSTFYGQRLVTAAWATRSPWSIDIIMTTYTWILHL